jgi:hypothetical protein
VSQLRETAGCGRRLVWHAMSVSRRRRRWWYARYGKGMVRGCGKDGASAPRAIVPIHLALAPAPAAFFARHLDVSSGGEHFLAGDDDLRLSSASYDEAASAMGATSAQRRRWMMMVAY